jgi:hypothetical protein
MIFMKLCISPMGDHAFWWELGDVIHPEAKKGRNSSWSWKKELPGS